MLDVGIFRMRPGVLELIAGIALCRVEGASNIGGRSDRREDARKRKNLSKGIKAEVEKENIILDLDVSIDFGKNFNDVSKEIQREVKKAVESMTGWTVEAVNVDVVGVNAL
jgi:uncharacterized alkaline shock family protein YloU